MAADGQYIVIEGSDGTGKTTQMNMLRDYLVSLGKSVHITSEPADPHDDTEPLAIARELRKLIKNGEIARSPQTNILLFTAARYEKWTQEIQPALKQGSYVLSSRNYWSTLAYQGYGEGMDIDFIVRQTQLYLGDTGYMTPDIGIILTMQDEVARQRRVNARGLLEQKDTFESKNQAFQTGVANGYAKIAESYHLTQIAADASPEQVHEEIVAFVSTQLAPSVDKRK